MESDMIKGLRLATIWSEDLNNLLPFYRDVVGLTPGMESPGFVILGDPDGVALALGTHSEVRGRATDPNRHMVLLETDDCAREHRRLKDAGVDFVQEPEQMPGGLTLATFRDPEGNLVQIAQFDGAS
jgi:predicted enzyme related to lactoylglutathione lyase